MSVQGLHAQGELNTRTQATLATTNSPTLTTTASRPQSDVLQNSSSRKIFAAKFLSGCGSLIKKIAILIKGIAFMLLALVIIIPLFAAYGIRRGVKTIKSHFSKNNEPSRLE